MTFFIYLLFQERMHFNVRDIVQGKITKDGVTEAILTQGRSFGIDFESESYRH